ncbi:head completion/stabilization protein [Salmonella enterica]|nr:head completion/stabilization protein [Salmonella enterica]
MNLKPDYQPQQNEDATTGALTNDGFWPDLVMADFRRSRTIPLDIAASLAEQALLSAVFEVNAALAGVKTRYTAQGINQAADVEGPRLNGKNALCAQYEKAVFARAKADLLGEFTAVNTRHADSNIDSNDTRETLLAEAAFVLRAIQGADRVGVYIL